MNRPCCYHFRQKIYCVRYLYTFWHLLLSHTHIANNIFHHKSVKMIENVDIAYVSRVGVCCKADLAEVEFSPFFSVKLLLLYV